MESNDIHPCTDRDKQLTNALQEIVDQYVQGVWPGSVAPRVLVEEDDNDDGYEISCQLGIPLFGRADLYRCMLSVKACPVGDSEDVKRSRLAKKVFEMIHLMALGTRPTGDGLGVEISPERHHEEEVHALLHLDSQFVKTPDPK